MSRRPVLSARVPEDFYEVIKAAAKTSGRTISEEVIWRTRNSFACEEKSMIVRAHQVEFHTNRFKPALARARCSCGWFYFGTLAECQRRAGSHDLEWIAEPVDTTNKPLALVQP